MNSHELLDVIGQAQDTYILRASQTRKECHTMPKKHKPAGVRRRLLIAAAVISLLALTGCAAKAAEYVSDLFAAYFRQWGQELEQSQVEYIQSSTQPTVAQTIQAGPENGYSLSVRSALTDGKTAYITVDITAPEGVSLEDGEIRFQENPLLIPEETAGLVIAPDGSSPDAMCDYETVDDGDGKANTASVVFCVSPALENDSLYPFDGSVHWTMQAGSFYQSIFDPETQQFSQEELGAGAYEFDLRFEAIDTRQVEFVAEPIPMKASLFLHEEYTIDCTLTSFTLSGLTRGTVFTSDYPLGENELLDIGDVAIVMKDGTSKTLLRVTQTDRGAAPLGTPILLADVDYLLLRDGTRLYPQS